MQTLYLGKPKLSYHLHDCDVMAVIKAECQLVLYVAGHTSIIRLF
jgi:hypothetical protein